MPNCGQHGQHFSTKTFFNQNCNYFDSGRGPVVGLQGLASGIQGLNAGAQLNGLQDTFGLQATFGEQSEGIHGPDECVFSLIGLTSVTKIISLGIIFSPPLSSYSQIFDKSS